jgi:hypothetical protein
MTSASFEDRREWRKAFHATTAPAIVAALAKLEPDAGWTIEATEETDRYHNPALCNSRGERFWLALDEYKRKLTVHGTYGKMPDGRIWIPRDRVRDAVDPSPTISAEKTPEQIARDILRRFLPDYRTNLASYRAHVAEASAYRDKTATLFDEIVTLGDGWIRVDRHHDERASERTASVYNAPGINYGNVRVSGDYVRLELSVTPEFAKRFASLIRSDAATVPDDGGEPEDQR